MTTWLLLRGLTREARHWGRFPHLLQSRLPNARIETIDLPGCGRQNGIRSPATIEAIAAHCRAQVLNRSMAPPFNLLAMSLGAMVAVAWADLYPHDINACVLINSSLRSFSPIHHRLRPGSYLPLLRLMLSKSEQAREALVFQLTSTVDRERAGVIDDWTRLRQECPVSAGNTLRQIIAAARYCGPTVHPAIPLLILSSRRDALVNPDCSKQLANAWQADHMEHPDAGHDLALDDAPWVANRIADWALRRDL